VILFIDLTFNPFLALKNAKIFKEKYYFFFEWGVQIKAFLALIQLKTKNSHVGESFYKKLKLYV